MHRLIIVLTMYLLGTAAAVAQDDRPEPMGSDRPSGNLARRARQRYDEESDKVEKTWMPRLLKARVRAREKYIDDLERALKTAKRDNQLDEALLVKDEIDRIRAEIAEIETRLKELAGQFEQLEARLGYKLKRRPEGAVAYNGRWYMLIDKPVTWTEAVKQCRDMGGYLVTIADGKEHEFVWNLCGKKACWLGATDEDEEGKWRWITGERSDYTAWLAGEPNNTGGKEHYLMMGLEVEGKPNPAWNDAPVEGSFRKHVFVCEWVK